MLVVLVRLYSYACKCSVALYVIRLSEESVSCRESALEKLLYIYLAACRSKCQEIHVVDMYVTFSVRFGMIRLEHEHLIKLFRTFGTVLEHSSHRCIAIYVGILALCVIVLGFFESKILIYFHESRVHVSHSRTLSPVKYEFFGSPRMTVLDQHLLYSILYLLYGRYIIVAYLQKIHLDLSCQEPRHIVIFAAKHLCSFIDGVCDLVDIKVNSPAVSFDDLLYLIHTYSPLSPLYIVSSFVTVINYTQNTERVKTIPVYLNALFVKHKRLKKTTLSRKR